MGHEDYVPADHESDDIESPWDEASVEEGRGRSKQKRAAQALTDLGKQLVELDAASLSRFDLPNELLKEIRAAQGMKFGARKRQLKFIGGLLRRLDTESIETTMATLEALKQNIDATFHRCEQWRDRLLSDDANAVTEFMAEYPQADAGQLRQLIRNARQEILHNKGPKSARQLFRMIRDTLASEGD